MIDKHKLYDATDDGMRILALHYPGVEESARTGKPFKCRPEERTPSAYVKKYRRSKDMGEGFVWKVTDFGQDDRAKDPIQIHMEERCLKFNEALLDLAAIFNIEDERGRAANRPDVRKEPAKADQEDGNTYWKISQEFTDAECKVMGPKVTTDHLKALHWYRAEWIASVKEREATYKYSNEYYPIFMRECWYEEGGEMRRFYKIYEPLNTDKGWRFQYQPKGAKPQSYVNGLYELRQAWREMNEAAEKDFFKDPLNEGKPYKEQKFKEAIICSGERDALCVKAQGYFPLWFNSETYQVSLAEIREIMRYVETLYNIPDIDATGRRKGSELALKYIDIHTVWLPDELRQFRDRRGHSCKDFRDWCEKWKSKEAFHALLENATPARFWKTTVNSKTGEKKSTIDVSCLFEFLNLNGFYTYVEKNRTDVEFVRVTDNIVKTVTCREIRNFVWKWSVKTGQPRYLRNLVLTTPVLGQATLEALKNIELDFTNYTPHSQLFYFPRFSIEVTGKGFKKNEYRNVLTDRYVWDDNIIKHDIELLPDMFEITHPEGSFDSEDFDIKINNIDSNYFRYLINSSRIYWRKELEENISWMLPEDREHYLKVNKFRIDGEALSPEEIAEQKQCLINKIFTIGFLMHRFKQESRAWAPFAMDNVIGDGEQCNGRSGKSFMFRSLSHFTKWHKLSGRDPHFFDNKHSFEKVSSSQTFVVIDDCDKYFPFRQFYDSITSDITINPKNEKSYNLNYMEAPKFVFTTNYVPRDFDVSSMARMLFVVFSDYYHVQSVDNNYRETRSIRDDFGKDLFTGIYSEPEWCADINFVMQCVKFYLSVAPHPVKIQPNLDNIIFRRHIQEMSENFRDWASGYFAADENGYGENLDKKLVREDVFEDFRRHTNQFKVTMQKFTKSLRSYCYVADHIEDMNPEELTRSDGRILDRIKDSTGTSKTKEMIYIRSKAAKRDGKLNANPEPGKTSYNNPADLFAKS